jgi:hypothetical protein
MTRQIKDLLVYDGESYFLNQELLEPFFREYPEKKPVPEVICTALWKGYLATFEIRQGELFVQKIEIFKNTGLNTELVNDLFPNNNKFEWFSGLIRIDGYRGEWDDEKEGSLFQYLEIYRGNLVRLRVMNFEELAIFKAYQFEYFKTTREYEKEYALWRNNNSGMKDAEIDEYIYDGLLRIYCREVFDNPAIFNT